MDCTMNHETSRPDGTRIHYTATGSADGPTLTLIHGWGCDRGDFDTIVEHGDSRSRSRPPGCFRTRSPG